MEGLVSGVVCLELRSFWPPTLCGQQDSLDVYNVTAGGREHSHQIMDEHGRHIYARAIGGDHPWIELDRMVALRWLESLTPEKMEKLMKVTDMNTLELIMNIAYSDPVEENTFEKRMSL